MKQIILSAVFAISLVFPTHAAEVEPRYTAGALSFSGGNGFTQAKLMITGPNDFEAEESASRGLPVFRVRGGRMKDGFYQFTVTAATDVKVKIKKPMDNGRGSAAKDYTFESFHLSGMFEIKRGTIVPIAENTKGADGDQVEE